LCLKIYHVSEHTHTHTKHHIIYIRGDEKMLLHEGPRNQQNVIWEENDNRKYGKGKQTGWNLSIQQHLKGPPVDLLEPPSPLSKNNK